MSNWVSTNWARETIALWKKSFTAECVPECVSMADQFSAACDLIDQLEARLAARESIRSDEAQMIITIADIRALKPCYDPVKFVSEDWAGTVLDILKLEVVPALRQVLRERDDLRAKLKIATDALKEISMACHVADAREALAKIKA